MKFLKLMIIAAVCSTQLHEYAIGMPPRVAKPFEGPKIKSSSSRKDQIDLNLEAQDQNIQSSDSTMQNQSLSLGLPSKITTQTNQKLSQAPTKPLKKIIDEVDSTIPNRSLSVGLPGEIITREAIDIISQLNNPLVPQEKKITLIKQAIENQEAPTIAQIRYFIKKNKTLDSNNSLEDILNTKPTEYSSPKAGLTFKLPFERIVSYRIPEYKFIKPEIKRIFDESSTPQEANQKLQNLILQTNDMSILSNIRYIQGISNLTSFFLDNKIHLKYLLNSKKSVNQKLTYLENDMGQKLTMYNHFSEELVTEFINALETVYLDEITKLKALQPAKKSAAQTIYKQPIYISTNSQIQYPLHSKISPEVQKIIDTSLTPQEANQKLKNLIFTSRDQNTLECISILRSSAKPENDILTPTRFLLKMKHKGLTQPEISNERINIHFRKIWDILKSNDSQTLKSIKDKIIKDKINDSEVNSFLKEKLETILPIVESSESNAIKIEKLQDAKNNLEKLYKDKDKGSPSYLYELKEMYQKEIMKYKKT